MLAPLCAVELALDFVVLALYDVTVMCDDSASMKVAGAPESSSSLLYVCQAKPDMHEGVLHAYHRPPHSGRLMMLCLLPASCAVCGEGDAHRRPEGHHRARDIRDHAVRQV